jgi:hypothetical protein
MQGINLEPAHSLLRDFSQRELLHLAKLNRIDTGRSRQRARLVEAITRHLDMDEIVDAVTAAFSRPAPARQSATRLDRLPPLHGDATVHVYSQTKPALGRLLIDRGAHCSVVTLNNTPLFLENRWPVIATAAAEVPHSRLYAAFVRRGKVHPSAEAPPGRDRPFLLDAGAYQLRNSRLRLELTHSGPLSFFVTFLRSRTPGNRPQYLLEPIA